MRTPIRRILRTPSDLNIFSPSRLHSRSLRIVIRCDSDPDAAEITVDGTIKMCEDMGVDPEDVVLLAIAYELKSPRMGEWPKQGWLDGWKSLG